MKNLPKRLIKYLVKIQKRSKKRTNLVRFYVYNNKA